jgi:hypothetical protein
MNPPFVWESIHSSEIPFENDLILPFIFRLLPLFRLGEKEKKKKNGCRINERGIHIYSSCHNRAGIESHEKRAAAAVSWPREVGESESDRSDYSVRDLSLSSIHFYTFLDSNLRLLFLKREGRNSLSVYVCVCVHRKWETVVVATRWKHLATAIKEAENRRPLCVYSTVCV